MLFVDRQTLRIGLERAHDLLRLHRLSGFADAELMASKAFANFGLADSERPLLADALVKMLPVTGNPLMESLMASSMGAGVLVGLLIADAALPTDAGPVPDYPPADA
jgi:hypothetical protein